MKRTLMTTAVVLGAWISIGNVAWSAPLPLIVAHPPLCTSAAPVVFVKGGSYSPKLAIHTSPGASEKWDWATGGIAESVTSTDFKLFSSGIKTSGTYTFTFFAAGAYRYHSNGADTQIGTIAVPMCLNSTGNVGDAQILVYGSAHHTGWVSDVEIKRPGSTTWRWLGYGLKGTQTSFTPTVTGTYHFRARLRRVASGKVSRFGPARGLKAS